MCALCLLNPQVHLRIAKFHTQLTIKTPMSLYLRLSHFKNWMTNVIYCYKDVYVPQEI